MVDLQGKEDEGAENLRKNVHVLGTALVMADLDFEGQGDDEAAEHLRNVHVLGTAPVAAADLHGQQDDDDEVAPAMVEGQMVEATAHPVVGQEDDDLPLLDRFFKALLMIVCWCCSNELDINGDDDTQLTLRRTPASTLPLSCTCIYEFFGDGSPPLRRYICGYHYNIEPGDQGASPRLPNVFNNPVSEDDD